MRIALTVKGAGLGAWLDDDFFHCRQVMIVNDENRFESFINPVDYDGEENRDILAEAILNAKVDVLVTNHIPQDVSDRLLKKGIKVLIKNSGTVFDLVEEARKFYDG